MPWYDQILGNIVENQPVHREQGEYIESVSLSADRLQGLASRLGLKVVTADDGTFISLPQNLDLGDGDIKLQFIDHWLSESINKSRTEEDRNRRTQTYKIMDESMAESVIALDTYADEALAVGFVDDPISIQFSDKNIGKQVLAILDKTEFLKRSRSHVRNLIKYGDIGFKVVLPTIDKDVSDIGLDYVDPLLWECVIPKEQRIAVGYKIDEKFNRWVRTPTTGIARKKILQPWEFIQLSVFDIDLKPYGRSMLEGLRIDFDHLVTLEALLALSRASRVERLVIKIPTGVTNPIQAAAKIQALKAQFKNIIFKDTSLGTKTYGKTPGLTDILFMPSDQGFEADKLSSTVDLSSVEDVEYFRNKAISVTGLPKGYFLADTVTDRGAALQQQDIKFARKLLQYQNAYIEGVTKLCMILSVYCAKADLLDLEIQVGLKRPAQVAMSMIDNYKVMTETAALMIQSYKSAVGTIDPATGQQIAPPVPPELYSNLLKAFGIPKSIADQFLPGNVPGKAANPDQDYLVLKSSKDLAFSHVRSGLRSFAEELRGEPRGHGQLRLIS